MNKLFLSAVSAAAIAGVAVAADSTQFGVLKVPSSAAQTIVAVPWLGSGTGSEPVKVADLVLTAGLHEGDELRLYDNGSWTKSWQLTDGKWVGGNMQSDQGSSQSGDDQTTIARGKAIMLIRSTPASCFYIMGKPTTDAASPTPLLAGGYTLIAPPTVANDGTSINDGLTWTGVEAGDILYVPTVNGGILAYRYYNTSKTTGWRNTTTGSLTDTIPTGMGAWFYTSKATSGKQVSLK